jgi:large conductance mechanosensitive channel
MARRAVSLRRWATVIRDFAASGQFLDLSVAFIIGNAFTKMVEALVNNLLTPILGFLFDGIDIAELKTTLKSDRWPHKTPNLLQVIAQSLKK